MSIVTFDQNTSTSYLKKLTAICVSPTVETVRTECGSVEVAYDAERADSTPGFPEVKQEYVTRNFSI